MPDKEKHEGLPQRDAVKDQQSERPETADVLAAAREPLPSSAPSLPSAVSSVSAQTADAELVPEPNSAPLAADGDAAGAGAADATPVVTGPEVIQRYLKLLPAAPGVYRMLDAEGNVIYVGKARSLKARVSNYTRLGGHTNRIARMIATTASMEFVSVRTEAEALLLEANLIKRFRPRFNVLMRDDKSFPYILIARDTPAPQILKHRGARNRKGDYFGPFASAGAVSRTINMLERAFLLRSCSDSVYESRTRPCLLHQIKRCAAPCTGEISLDEYGHLVDEAVRFLRGESQNVRRMYQSLMEEAAACLEYERAARYRDRLSALAHVTADQSINPEGIEEADVFAAAQEGGQTCIEVFFFRTGQNWGNRAYFPKADRALSVEEVLDSFIAQFYDDKPVPRLILLSHDVPSRDLLAEALCIKSERRTEIQVPQRGTKLGIVDHALANAREALGRKLAESSSQRRLLEGVAERFGLPETPRRIEVYDNSHIQGTNAVGAMIVAGPDGFVKGQYRKFNIKSQTITPGDDYGMMREVLTRRFKRLVASENKEARKVDAGLVENVEAAELAGMIAADNASAAAMDSEMPETNASEDDVFPDRPDLVLIDGGAGQLAVAREVMSELGLNDIQLIGVAKGPDRDAGREHFHFPFRERSIMLEPRDPVLYFVQRLRDEAHRFAIGSHRTRRSMAITASPLDEIEGIGPRRRRALMSHFGSAKAVSRAGVEDLKAVEGISAEMARRIYDHFHERRS
ncbi:Excinuclease ABC subunit C [Hyphomicrobium sulfonivorans]|uniref:UvrABC system protein C n=1 Tax=Hyphomicrobium sulfonivorans TaxID=121290 RepID=A0A120CTA6_HYPSL|nr:excinuclease ABC subunit UvrC [Hyphomicrobium sulfonivorans]KWT64392.1 Excinuclease ABC subunit C [Hyphomicrobium sulfonivorans]